METLHIRHVIEDIGLGCTNPMKAVTDNGQYAVIKLFYNGQGNKVLFNEYFACQLSRTLGLPTPDCFIGIIDAKTVTPPDFEERNRGFCFCSAYLSPVTTLIPEVIKHLANREQFNDILLFDHFIYNADRNSGNLLVTIKPTRKMYAIDYSHIFTDSDSWDRFQLLEIMGRSMKDDRTIMKSNAEMYQMFISANCLDKDLLSNRVSERYGKLSKDYMYGIIHATPEQWRPSSEDCQVLVDYLTFRQSNLAEAVSSMIAQTRERR